VRKPNQLKYNKRIEEATKLVGSLNMAPSDDLLVHYVRFQQFTQEVEEVFRYDDPDAMEELDAWKTHTMAKAFERKLAQIKESTPPEALANREFSKSHGRFVLTLMTYARVGRYLGIYLFRVPANLASSNYLHTAFVQLGFLFLPIYINEIGLRSPPGHDHKGVDCCDWCPSAFRAELIVSCVRASHAFLDAFMALPDAVIRMLNVAEIGRYLYAIIVLGRVGMRSGMGSLDRTLRGELASLGPYLEASERRIASLITYLPDHQPKHDSYWQLQQLFQSASSVSSPLSRCPFRTPVKRTGNRVLIRVMTLRKRC
jgi:hypothetical protein